jgi:hypothetical protein
MTARDSSRYNNGRKMYAAEVRNASADSPILHRRIRLFSITAEIAGSARFPRPSVSEQLWSARSMHGSLLELPRKSIEPMVLALRDADRNAVRAMQQFLSDGA